MLSDQAFKLAQETKSQLVLQTLKPYNDELIRQLILETNHLNRHLTTLLSTQTINEDSTSQILLLHLTIHYNKRCLLVYHSTRLSLLLSSFSSSISSSISSSLLSSQEVLFLKKYSTIYNDWKQNWLTYLDPSSSSSRPVPIDLLVTVVGVKEIKDIETEIGRVNVRVGERMTLRREVVDGLVARNWVHIVDDD